MESGLEGCQSVVLEHVQECLRGKVSSADMIAITVAAHCLSGIVETQEQELGACKAEQSATRFSAFNLCFASAQRQLGSSETHSCS